MKKLIPVLSFILLIHLACSKDDTKKKDYVTDFTPVLTETSGKSYSGDYYPFKVGNEWNWSGTATTAGKMTISSGGQSQDEPLDGTENAYGYMNIVGNESISLSSGSYDVLYTSETDGTSRYFEVTDAAILLRAIRTSDMSEIAEVKNPTFIKIPLVVGDQWETEPEVDYSQFTSISDGIGSIDLTMKCKMFVLGNEDITWKSAQTSTVVLQERALITGKITPGQGMTGSININVTADIKMYLKKDVGIVKQDMTMVMSMNGTISAQGQSAKITMNANVESTMSLGSYTLDGVYSYKSANVNNTNKQLPIIKSNMKFAKEINSAVSVVNKLKNSFKPF
jgi:hypothetical protein